MKIAALSLIAAAVLLGAFAAWGLFTTAGKHRFDEMAGIIPMAAGVLAGLLALAGLICGYYVLRST